jgi:acyl-CoA thioesterase-1
MLARRDSAVPNGTKVVILDVRGGIFNARRKTASNQTDALHAVVDRLRARYIKIIPASTKGLTKKYRQVDGIHLTVEGHATMAARLLPSVIRALC